MRAIGLVAAMAAACAAAPDSGVLRPVALRNAGFENAPRAGERCPEHWGCTMHSNPDSFRFRVVDGSLCIERVLNEPWALATQGITDPSLHGARLRFSIRVRSDEVVGDGGGLFVVVHGHRGNLAHEQRLVKSTRGWERLSVEFTVDPAARMVEVGAILQGGGRMCFDDARLEVVAAR